MILAILAGGSAGEQAVGQAPEVFQPMAAPSGHALPRLNAATSGLDVVGVLPGGFAAVWSDGQFAYLESVEPFQKAIQIARVDEREAPQRIGSVDGGGRPQARGACLFLVGSAILAFDTTVPAAPGRIGMYVRAGSIAPMRDILVDGDVGYVAHAHYGLLIMDLRRARAMAALGAIDLPGDSQRVALDGHVVAVANGLAGVSLIDVSDVRAPSLLANFSDPLLNAKDVDLAGNHLYIAGDGGEPWLIPSGLAPTHDGLWVVDISQPSRPREVARVTFGQHLTEGVEVFVAGDRVYLAMKQLGLKAFDVSRPARPREIAVWQPPPPVWDVNGHGDRLFVTYRGAESERGLAILQPTGMVARHNASTFGGEPSQLPSIRLFLPSVAASRCE